MTLARLIAELAKVVADRPHMAERDVWSCCTDAAGEVHAFLDVGVLAFKDEDGNSNVAIEGKDPEITR